MVVRGLAQGVVVVEEEGQGLEAQWRAMEAVVVGTPEREECRRAALEAGTEGLECSIEEEQLK
jgi:hypothetical protein